MRSPEDFPADIRETVRAFGDEKFGEVALYGWPRVMERALLAERLSATERAAKIAETWGAMSSGANHMSAAINIAAAIRSQP